MTSIGSTTVLRQAFSGLERETLNGIRKVATRRKYPEQTTLCHQGEIEHVFYVIVKGHIAVSQADEDGNERLLGVLGPNQFFGEMGLIDDEPRMASCITMTPATVLEVSEEAFDNFIVHSPGVAYNLLRNILASARNNDRLYIEELKEKNEALEAAYKELQAAQAELVVKERMERGLELAAEVQRSLLPPRLPQFEDYSFASYLKPARQVGGDFYDVQAIDDEHVSVLVADVADKGMHAALFMAVSRTLFLQEGKRSVAPGAVAQAVHYGILGVASTDEVFVTAFYGILHRPSGRLTYVRAGQDKPLHYRPGEGVSTLDGKGRFLGMLPELHLEEYTVTLKSGDRLILFSDGVPDAVNFANKMYGVERLTSSLIAHGHQSAPDMVMNIAADVAKWTAGAEPFDDLTLLAVEVK